MNAKKPNPKRIHRMFAKLNFEQSFLNETAPFVKTKQARKTEGWGNLVLQHIFGSAPLFGQKLLPLQVSYQSLRVW